MILERVHIASFGALADRDFVFRPGLNLVIGPNEAGKSTMMHAIAALLLLPAKQGRKDFDQRLRRYLPAQGGDSISAELALVRGSEAARGSEADGGADRNERCVLRRTWSLEHPTEELILPHGGQFTAGVQVELERIIGLKSSVLKTVFLALQGQIAQTPDRLREDRQALHDAEDLFRRGLSELGGFSVSRFLEALDTRIDEAYSRWDDAAEAPENGRGLDNPWKREAGLILKAWYEREALAAELDKVRGADERARLLRDRILETEKGLRETETRLAAQRPAYDALLERLGVESERDKAMARKKTLDAAKEQWPRVAVELQSIGKERAGGAARKAALDSELLLAKRRRDAEGELRAFENARRKTDEAAEAERRLRGLVPLGDKALEDLQALQKSIEKAENAISAGTVSIHFHSASPRSVRLRKNDGEETEQTIPAGASLSAKADGRLTLASDDWELSVLAGAENPETLRTAIQDGRAKLAAALAGFGLACVADASAANRAYENARTASGIADKARREALGDRDYGSWASALETERAATETARPLDVIQAELAGLVAELGRAESEEKHLRVEETDFAASFGSMDGLYREIIETERKIGESAVLLEQLPALPPEYRGDAAAFRQTYERHRDTRDRLADALAELRSEKAAVEARAEEAESEEELVRRLEEASNRFDRSLKTGRALKRVRIKADAILDRSHRSDSGEFGKTLDAFVARLTEEGRRARFDLASGDAAVVRGSASLAYDQLSGGTQAVFALGLRLTLASFFLEADETAGTARAGFLLLDDPFVDLDPERKKKAAAVLSDFARRHQVVLFTCHPEHRELFPEAALIEM